MARPPPLPRSSTVSEWEQMAAKVRAEVVDSRERIARLQAEIEAERKLVEEGESVLSMLRTEIEHQHQRDR